MAYEPAHPGLPEETVWSTRKYLDFAPKLFDAVRSAHGYDFDLLHDVHHRLSPLEGAQLGKAAEAYRLFWLEDITPAENQDAFRLIRQHTTTPLAVGEILNTVWDAKTLIEAQLIDYLRMTVLGAGGITHLRRVADFAAVYGVRMGSHGATDLSPVTMGAALHFDLWVPNFGIQEYMRHTDETDAVFPHDYRFESGRLVPGDIPGHGVDIDEARAARHPYQRAYLPVARLEDGTMWNW
jgi:mannonate dehydratase